MADSSHRPAFTILYFAAASTYTSKTSERLPAPLPVSSLFSVLETKYPGIEAKVLRSCAVTVNLDYVDVLPQGRADGSAAGDERSVEMTIQEGDEVGIIPPVSSG